MKYEEAVDTLGLAIGVLKKRIDNLANKTESVDESKKDDAFYTREKEMAELESLIPEIKEKITDTNEMREELAMRIGLTESRVQVSLTFQYFMSTLTKNDVRLKQH